MTDAEESTSESESEEQAIAQLEQEVADLDTAFSEFEQQLAEERAESERVRGELARAYERIGELERGSDPVSDGGDEPGGAGELPVQPEGGSGSEPEPVGAAVLVVSTPEQPPRSSHPIYRRLFGRDEPGEPAGESFLHRRIKS